jgi:hypothetical protein
MNGSIWPVKNLTLLLIDGRSLRFSFDGIRGQISARGKLE